MLILTRREDEGIVIGNDVFLRVLSVTDGRVRIGISAPDEVGIFREEVWVRLKLEEGAEAPEGGG